MDKLFAFPFVITILTLNFLNISDNFNELINPVVMISFSTSLIFFILKKYTFSIIFISLSISLLIGNMYLEEREEFSTSSSMEISSDKYIKIRGKVLQFPVIGNSDSTIMVRTDNISISGKRKKINVVLRINVKGDLRWICMGDIIEIDTTIHKFRPPLNFYPSRSESYMFANGVHFSGYSKSALFTEKIKEAGFILQTAWWIRERVRKLIERKYLINGGGLKEEGQMMEALLLGDRGRVTPEIREMLLKTGVFHLFAISGAHIGIIALITMFLLKRTGLRERGRYLTLIIILLFFLLLTGFSISAVRAVMMAVLLVISKVFYLRSDPINILSFSGLILFIINPCCFLDPGFNLTFLITAGIISGRNLFFKETGKSNSYLKEAVSANLNAAVCSIPPSLLFFMRYSFSGLISGLILLPITAIIMTLSLPLIPLSLFPFFGTSLFVILPDITLKIFFFLTGSFAKSFDLSIFRPPPSTILVFLFCFFFFLLCYAGKNKYIKIIFIFVTVSILFLIIQNKSRYNPEFPEVYFLDVGQGDCHVVVLPGGDALLIDGGGSRFGDFEAGKQIALPFILKKGIRVRWIAVSHYHPDHCRGINEIVDILKPEEVLISSIPDNCPIFNKLSSRCGGFTKLREVASGFSIKNGEALIEIIYPFNILKPFSTKNDHSQVLKVTFGNHKILFTGDIEIFSEKSIVKKYGKRLKCNVLKVPHHGSATSSTPDFLKMCSPDIAIFPLGHKNSFGFPDNEVLKRYKMLNARLFFTSKHGGIMVRFRPGKIEFEVSRFPAQKSVNF